MRDVSGDFISFYRFLLECGRRSIYGEREKADFISIRSKGYSALKKLLQNRLLSNVFIFTLSTVVNKGLNFFVLPILTYYLTKEDYGYLGFIMSVVTITSIYIGLWPGNFLVAKFSNYGKEKMARYISNIFVILLVTFIAVTGLLFGLEDVIFSAFSDRTEVILLIAFYTLFMVCFNILNTITQLEKNAKKYALMQFLYSFSSLGIALVLIIKLHFGWKGKFFAELAVLLLLSLYMFYYFVKERYVVFDISKARLKELFAYLFPMTFHVVGIFLMVTIDKVILAKYMDLEAVGIYTISMTMAMIVNIVFDSTIRAWEPYLFEKIHTGRAEDMNWIIKSLVVYSLFIVVAALIYVWLIPFIFPIMVDEKFMDALHFIPFLVVAFSLEGLRKPLSSFLMHKNKVKTLGSVSLLTAFINIALNVVWIQKFGIMGAVYATVCSFLFLYIVTIFLVKRYCNIRYTRL